MIPTLRTAYNEAFQVEKYQAMVADIERRYNHKIPFSVSETPVFVPKALKQKLFDACEEIATVLMRPDFKNLSEKALMAGQVVPNETAHTTFLQMDFGICVNENGEFYPQLIEIQGFPSLYHYQYELAKGYREFFDIPSNFNHLFNGLTEETYLERLKQIIVGDENPEQVVLLEVEPHKQATQIDFIICEQKLGIKVLCVSDVVKEGKKLFYKKDGQKVPIKRIYNRVIFDELVKRDDLKREFYLTEEADVEWVGHPNWFFRISKHTLPLLKSKYVPDSIYLNEIKEIPANLDRYVLKPLYSFAGSGVIINLNPHDLESIKDPENYILQQKIAYAPIIETLDVNAKCEIRMLMLWDDDREKPQIVNNLVRLSKAEMVGVRYNKGKTWVGGSIGFFED